MEPHLGKRIKCFRSLGFFFFLLLLFFFDFKFVQSSIAEQFSGLFEERNEGKPKTVKKKREKEEISPKWKSTSIVSQPHSDTAL